MNRLKNTINLLNFSSLLVLIASLSFSTLQAEEQVHHDGEEDEVFEYNVGEFNPITGEGANLGGFIFPELFLNATGGLLGAGTTAADLATAEHDPQNEAGIQGIELHLNIDLNGLVTGAVYGSGNHGEAEWEANLEEAYLHYHLTDWFAIGGGQFLNRFGFQAENHLHDWDFVNQNLVNSRMLNEGELVTQGGEMIINLPKDNGVLTIGGGGVRSHAHEHDHAHEEEGGEHGDEDAEHLHGEEGEEHHLEADEANFTSWVLSGDFRYRFPFDESATLSTSLATGENGFERQTWAYGVGLEKIWGSHDHGHGPEFCSNAVMLRAEFIGRHIGVADEDGDRFNVNDSGVSTALFYGLSDSTTVSLRHDWVSDLDALQLENRHRISPALTTYIDKNRRVQARIQYDFNHSETLGDEHSAWLQFQIQWGGHGGAHHHH